MERGRTQFVMEGDVEDMVHDGLDLNNWDNTSLVSTPIEHVSNFVTKVLTDRRGWKRWLKDRSRKSVGSVVESCKRKGERGETIMDGGKVQCFVREKRMKVDTRVDDVKENLYEGDKEMEVVGNALYQISIAANVHADWMQ